MKLGKLLAAGKSIMNGRGKISYRANKQIYLPKFNAATNPFKPQTAAETAPESLPPSPPWGRGIEGEGENVKAPFTVHGENSPKMISRIEPLNQSAHPTFQTTGGPFSLSQRERAGVREKNPAPVHGEPRPPKLDAHRSHEPQGGASVPASHAWVERATSPLRRATCPPPVHGEGENAQVPFAVHGKNIQKNEKKPHWMGKLNPISIFRGARAKDASTSGVFRMQKAATQTELSLDRVKVVHNDLSDVDVEIVPIKSRSSAPELPPPKKSWEFLGERLFGVETL